MSRLKVNLDDFEDVNDTTMRRVLVDLCGILQITDYTNLPARLNKVKRERNIFATELELYKSFLEKTMYKLRDKEYDSE